MFINDQELQLACAVLPGLMSRCDQAGYSDSGAIYEAFLLARDCLGELRKNYEAVESAPKSPNKPMPCCCRTDVILGQPVLVIDQQCSQHGRTA